MAANITRAAIRKLSIYCGVFKGSIGIHEGSCFSLEEYRAYAGPSLDLSPWPMVSEQIYRDPRVWRWQRCGVNQYHEFGPGPLVRLFIGSSYAIVAPNPRQRGLLGKEYADAS